MVLQRHLGAMRRRPPEEEPEGPFAVGDLALTPGDTLEICFLITSVNRKKKTFAPKPSDGLAGGSWSNQKTLLPILTAPRFVPVLIER